MFTRIQRNFESTPLYSIEVFVGDRSGSMRSMGESPQVGTHEFITERHKNACDKNINGDFICVTFDSEATQVFNKPLKNITKKDIHLAVVEMTPRNTTRLVDTIYETIEKMIKMVEKFKKKLSREVLTLDPNIKLVIAILTDGDDNVSERTDKDLNKLINIFKEDYGGVVLFLAANQDSIKTGEKFGISKGECITFSSNVEGSKNVFKSANMAVSRAYSSNFSNGDYFTKQERNASLVP